MKRPNVKESFEDSKKGKESFTGGKETLDPRNNEDFVYHFEENKITWTNEVKGTGVEDNPLASHMNDDDSSAGTEEDSDTDKYKSKSSGSSESSEAAASSSSSASSSATTASTTTSVGTAVQTVAVATTTAVIVVIGGGMALQSQSFTKPNIVQVADISSMKNSISFSLAIGTSEEEANDTEHNGSSCDVVVELTCESYEDVREEHFITQYGFYGEANNSQIVFDNLLTGTVYTINVAQRTFLDLNREYLIDPITVSTIPNTPVSMTTSGQTTAFPANSEFYYDGTCTVTYDDGSTEVIDSSKLTIESSQVDMTTQGKYPVNLIYSESETTVSASYEAEVLAADIIISAEQTATATHYYSEVNMYLSNARSTYSSFYMSLVQDYVNYGANYEELANSEICYVSLNRQDPFVKQEIYFDVPEDDLAGTKYLTLWGNVEKEEMPEGYTEPITVEVPELLVCERIDLSQLDKDILPVPVSVEIAGQTTEFKANADFVFDGSVIVTYDDGSTRTLDDGEFGINDNAVDMTTQGIYQVVIMISENDEYLEKPYNIEVFAGELTLTATSNPLGEVTYYSEFDMYITNPTDKYIGFSMLITNEQLSYDADYDEESENSVDSITLPADNPLDKQAISFEIADPNNATWFSLWGDKVDDSQAGTATVKELVLCQLINLPSIEAVPLDETNIYIERCLDESNPPKTSYGAIFTYAGEYNKSDIDPINYSIYDNQDNYVCYGRVSAFDEYFYLDLSEATNFDDNGIYKFDVYCNNHDETFVNAYNAEHGESGSVTIEEGAPYTLGPITVDFSTINTVSVKTEPVIEEVEFLWYNTDNNRDYRAFVRIQKDDPGQHYMPDGLVLYDVENNNADYLYTIVQTGWDSDLYEIIGGHDIFDPTGQSYTDKFNGTVTVDVYVQSTYESDTPQRKLIDNIEGNSTSRSAWEESYETASTYASLMFFTDGDDITDAPLQITLNGASFNDNEEYKVIFTNCEDETESYTFVFDFNTYGSRDIYVSDFPPRSGNYKVATYISQGGVDKMLFEEIVEISTIMTGH